MVIRVESQAEPIPGYRLLERLGGGGFGEVWKAVAPGGILKAIKFVYGDLEAAEGDGPRAEQELKALNRIKTVRHPYVLSLERYDIIDGQLLIVMELADQNLWDRFRDCRNQGLPGIPREELLRYMDETSEALDMMSKEYQLQHLDIKPQNIFLLHNHVKVADFGLVKDLEGMMASVTGGVTPVYAAPETFDGWVSRFCDQYSLAIVYQELLTGQRPFAGNNVRQLIMQHLQASPNLQPLPEGDRAPIGRALAKNPDDRFPTCTDLMHALRGTTKPTNGSQAAPVETLQPESAAVQPDTTPKAPHRPRPSDAVAKEKPAAKPGTPAPEIPSPHPAGDTQWIRVQAAAERAPEEKAAPPVLRQETKGEGILFPSLVVGLGHLGLRVLRSLRAQLHEQFGGPEKMPHLRFLYLDTDPNAFMSAMEESPDRTLTAGEVLVARLNRPSYYLRSHHGRERIQTWFNFKMLYRIPRSLSTTGMRALGRLAFVDNIRQISRRLRSELETCTRPEFLSEVAQRSGLGMWTNFPRVYIATSLAGGTGSGMFLDLAYLVRSLVRDLGFDHAEVVGLFLLPAVDRQPGRALALGNAFAALTELHHFSCAETKFSARYDDTQKIDDERQPPYTRSIVLTLPEGADEGPVNEATELAATLLSRELVTSLGRAADGQRGRLPVSDVARSLTCQTFGMYCISWPRQALVRNVSRRVCHKLVKRWVSKDAAAVRDLIAAAVPEFWNREALTGEQLILHLQAAGDRALERPADEVFAEITQVLSEWEDQPEVSPSLPSEVLNRVLELVGQPEATVGYRPGLVFESLKVATEKLVSDWSNRLTGFTVQFIEEPRFRLAGAEEAARQVILALERLLVHYEGIYQESAARAADAYSGIGPLLAGLAVPNQPSRRTSQIVGTLVELLRGYPTWAYETLILRHVVNAFVSLRGRISEQLREINYCRARLNELLQEFVKPVAVSPAGNVSSFRRDLFLAGCNNFEEAADQLLQSLDLKQLEGLDDRIQIAICQQFNSLVEICMTPANLLKRLEDLMEREAQSFVGARTTGADVAEMYLAHYERPEDAGDDVAGIYDEAAPALAGARFSGQAEIRIIATPDSTAGRRFAALACQALREAELHSITTRDEIVFYREIAQLSLADLDHLGSFGFEAYRQMLALENFTPHSRVDISEWRAAASPKAQSTDRGGTP